MKAIYLLLLPLLIFSCTRNGKTTASGDPLEQRINEIENSASIVWLDYNEAVALNEKKPKKIFVDVYTTWCGWCKRMDQTTFKDDKIANYMNDNFYAVKVDAESADKVTYKGKEMTESQLARDVFNATGYPTTVYLNEEQEVLQPIPGYLDVAMLNKILHFYGEDHYKTKTWEQFQMSFNTAE